MNTKKERPLYKHNPRHICLCYGYIGTGYHGLQVNADNPAIENLVFDVLIRTGILPENSHTNLAAIKWSEASRTDSGVHASAQILTFMADLPSFMKTSEVAQHLQNNLAPGAPITFWGSISVPNTFVAQKFANARRYYYLVPTYAFAKQDKQHLDFIRNEVLPVFVGTKNYHNYTKAVPALSKSAQRTIFEFSFSDPFQIEGVDYVLFTIYGESFMLNQIRKMVAAVLSVSHSIITLDQLHATFTTERWALMKFIGTGLLLDRVEYPGYLKKFNGEPPVQHDVEFRSCRPRIEQWQKTQLFPHIASEIKKGDLVNHWLQHVLFSYPTCPQTDENANKPNRMKIEHPKQVTLSSATEEKRSSWCLVA